MWASPIPPFCEGLFSGPPEILSSMSSIHITALAIYGLSMSDFASPMIPTIFATLAVCGIGSFGFHWTLMWGWQQIDTIAMTLSLNLGFILMLHLMFRDMWLRTIAPLILMACFFTMMSVSFMSKNLYNLCFTIEILLLIPFILASRFRTHYHLVTITGDADRLICLEGKVFGLIWRGMIIGLGSGVLWIFGETLCSQYPILTYVPFHAVWHFGIAYAMYCLLIPLGYIEALDSHKPHITSNLWLPKLKIDPSQLQLMYDCQYSYV